MHRPWCSRGTNEYDGINLLNQIVLDKNILSPSEALQLLDKGIYHALSVTIHSETKDGMDIALCAINKKTRTVDFAGAARPLLIVSGDEVRTIKGNRNSIGGHLMLDKEFTHESIQLEKGDMLYMFSDGYADQFGGPKGKKFKNKSLREMILDQRLKPMSQQKDIFSDKFEDWKGDLEQIDDMCLLGVKV